jgi:hypothetical protein
MLRLIASALLYIEALTSLGGVVKESDVVVRGTIENFSAEKKVLILKVGKGISGKCAYEKIRIDLGAGEGWHPDVVLKHAVVGAPVMIFYRKAENSDQAALALLYLNRYFLSAQGGDPVWRLSKIELAMSKVFSGTPLELADLLVKVASGRTKAPAANAALKAWTKETLEALPAPPKEGETWPAFDPAQVLK